MEKLALLSLSSDLKRIVQSIQRGSLANTKRFNQEAKRWLIKSQKNKNVALLKLLGKIEETLKQKNDLRKAEDCLMYSVLLQNRALQLK
ncbi:hypothetical protein A2W70_04890 [Candidatus Curtissbacteria bacterium RIFCSPLOWO2_02_41_11]|uniref:Uncharacterized protein n=1 Tax=Candidatus Curtissbacteria bacterium RIFCSPLOWO2_02_41_11 TaxID=1797731 RepID=A0A1F5HRJ1_9BACT|nr:MAG: hypothetical protein A2W70_04890 [Candidatus Curtissbacteria bacterium RIFCSPLOWO2_02_41_11]